MTANKLPKPAGCEVAVLSVDTCQVWLPRVVCDGVASGEADDLVWLLAHCDDGVTWGRCAAGRWHLSHEAFPDVSPLPTAANLQQLRLFGLQREVLIWRGEKGLEGRELSDRDTALVDESLRPRDETWLLLGDRVVAGARDPSASNEAVHFTLVGDGRGARHAPPWRLNSSDFGSERKRHWPMRLVVRHYFECDEQSGLVRVAASRLSDMKVIKPESRS
jgi:CRISPR-associated protein (TIGR03984 family)